MALCLGALVGLERQVAQQESGGEKDFPGVRTFAFLALTGALAVLVLEVFGPWMSVAIFLATTTFLVLRYSHDSSHRGDPGYTTELASLCIFAVGALAQAGSLLVAAMITIAMVALLRSKRVLHQAGQLLDPLEMEALIRFLVITGIVWPLLPDEAIDRFYGVLHPRDVWRMVVLISGVSFVGYILLRIRAGRSSQLILGMLGGLVSSTAASLSYSRAARKHAGTGRYEPLVLVAASTGLLRMALMLAIVGPALLPRVALPLAVMSGLGMGMGLAWPRSNVEPEPSPAFQNPLDLRLAFGFAGLYATILVLVAAAREHLGEAAVYVLSAGAALVGGDAPGLSLARLASDGQIALETASIGVIVVAIATTLGKAGIVTVVGRGPFARRVVPPLLLMAAAGIGVLAAVTLRQ